jgi:hypothetical protein
MGERTGGIHAKDGSGSEKRTAAGYARGGGKASAIPRGARSVGGSIAIAVMSWSPASIAASTPAAFRSVGVEPLRFSISTLNKCQFLAGGTAS